MNTSWLLVSSVAAAAVACAAAQGCPATQCESYFANAMGGPVDCCNHDYGANGKCVWGGAPVFFTRSRTCSSDGKKYSVLVKGNSQGPPGQAECRCKDAVAGSSSGGDVSGFGVVQLTIQMKPKHNMDINGADLGCDGKSFCKVCGSLDNVKNSCAGRPKCVAFTFSPNESCGYLKTSNSVSGRSGWVAYVRE